MSSERLWPHSELGSEAVNASRPFPFRTRSQVVFVNTGDVLEGRFLHSEMSNVDGLPGQAKKSLRRNDVLLTEIRPGNGRFAFVDFDPELHVVSTKFMIIETRGRVAPRFLYHVLTNNAALDTFQRIAESRSGTFPQITFESIAHFPVPVPPAAEQEELVRFLDALQSRIELLRETNATLEAIAQALFKSWFVDFDPVRAKMEGRPPEGMDEATAALFPDGFEESELGLVPTGWRAATLADAFEINPKRALKKAAIAPYLDMASLATSGHCVQPPISRTAGSGAKFSNGDTLLARITPCLENGKTAFVDFLKPYEVGWGSTEFIVLRAKASWPDYMGYLLCRHPAFRDYAIQSMSGTSGRQRVQNEVLARYPLVLSGDEIARAFGEILDSVQCRIAANHAMAQTLSTLRDTLLPRLISGQLRLPDIEHALKESLNV